MAQHQVTYITKPGIYESSEHITHIGNKSEGWYITREDAIRRIDAKTDEFYVYDALKRKYGWVGVVREKGHDPFLRTHADRDWNDNLLSLPRFPA